MAEPAERKRRKASKGNDVVEARIIADLVSNASPEFQRYMQQRGASAGTGPVGPQRAKPAPNPDAGAIRFPNVPTPRLPGGPVPGPVIGMPDQPSPLLPDTPSTPMPVMPLPGPNERQFPEHAMLQLLLSNPRLSAYAPTVDAGGPAMPGMARRPVPPMPMPAMPVPGVPAMPMPGSPIFYEDGSSEPAYTDPIFNPRVRPGLDPFNPIFEQHALLRLLGLV